MDHIDGRLYVSEETEVKIIKQGLKIDGRVYDGVMFSNVMMEELYEGQGVKKPREGFSAIPLKENQQLTLANWYYGLNGSELAIKISVFFGIDTSLQ